VFYSAETDFIFLVFYVFQQAKLSRLKDKGVFP